MGGCSIEFPLRGCYKQPKLWSCLARIGQNLWPVHTMLFRNTVRDPVSKGVPSAGGDEEDNKTVQSKPS
jgi:hypothetical protein